MRVFAVPNHNVRASADRMKSTRAAHDTTSESSSKISPWFKEPQVDERFLSGSKNLPADLTKEGGSKSSTTQTLKNIPRMNGTQYACKQTYRCMHCPIFRLRHLYLSSFIAATEGKLEIIHKGTYAAGGYHRPSLSLHQMKQRVCRSLKPLTGKRSKERVSSWLKQERKSRVWYN